MSRMVTIFALLLASSPSLYGADSAVRVELDSTKAGPRSVESLTEQVILRDYRFAWTSVAQALEFNTLDPLEGAFTGESKQALSRSVTNQQRSGLSQKYVDQNHKVQAVFYAPEGDVIELHDTAEYELQILDGGKLIHEEHVVAHYIVLMTPAADRWMVRHLQAVPQF
jgi:hemin uptake protein HemP